MLSIKNLTRPGVKSFSLNLKSGECITLTGPSGAGKTLLLRAIADLDPNQGSVFLNKVDRNDFAAPDWRRAVGYLPSESGWWGDHVGSHFPNQENARVLLPKLDIHPDALDWPVAQLSTGERQRLALVRLLTVSPKVMLLDEPTSGLDVQSEALVEKVLIEYLERGNAILLVTHSVDQVRRLSIQQFHMQAGFVSEVLV